MAKPKKLNFGREDVLRAFRMFAGPEAPAGTIAADILSDALQTYCGAKLSKEELRQLVGSLESTSAGFIDYERAVDVFMAGSK